MRMILFFCVTFCPLIFGSMSFGQSSGSEIDDRPVLLRELLSEVDSSEMNATGLSLREAVNRVLMNHPELLVARASSIAAQGKLIQAGKGQNPTVSLEVANFGRSSTSGIGELTIGIEKEIGLWGKRSIHKQSIAHEIQMYEQSYHSSLLDLFIQASVAYYRVVASELYLDNTREGVTIAKNIREVAANKFAEGAVPEVDLLRAREVEFEAEIELETQTAHFSRNRQMLASLWGGSSLPDTIDGSLRWWLDRKVTVPLEGLLATHPDLLALEFERDAREAELQSNRVSFRPDLTLGAGYRRLFDDDDNAFLVWTSLPLPLSDRNQGKIASAGAAVAQAEARIAAYKRETLNSLQSHLSLLATYSRQIHQIEETLLPLAERAMEATDAAYRLGSLPYLNVLQSRQDLVKLKQRLTDLLLSGTETALAIERLTGHRLSAIGSR